MAVYDFSRCNVLLVEDNLYVRNALEDMLRHFQFGRVTTADNGEDAIDYLKTMKSAGNTGPDIIFSDLAMAPINGLLLLRWVRASKDCPNRMVPFLMISGAADRDYVNSARDLGVTEFIAKPFSVTSVYERFLEVVDYPRQFVTTQNYFGPDRRRKSEGRNEDRREKSDSDVVIVYSADKKVKPTTPTDVWYWRLANNLRDKAARGAMGAKTKGEVPMDLIEEAEKELERAALDFTVWALDYLAKLSDLCTEALMEPGRRSRHFADIHDLALELRGQGGTFGYPLISTFGKMLYDVTMEGCREDDKAVEVVKCHIDSMRAVIREKVGGDGGELGRQLLKGLRMSIEKVDTVT
ncbi:MAG: response regulator [Rhodospirillales bacterium]|nr:response regulator [Rhodospirillales bacterium]